MSAAQEGQSAVSPRKRYFDQLLWSIHTLQEVFKSVFLNIALKMLFPHFENPVCFFMYQLAYVGGS